MGSRGVIPYRPVRPEGGGKPAPVPYFNELMKAQALLATPLAASAVRGSQTPWFQRIANLANRGLTGLQNVAQPYSDKLASSWASKPLITSLASLFGMSEVADPKESNVAMMIKGLMGSSKYIKASDEEKEQMMKNFLESVGIDIESALEQAGQELLEEEEPSIPEKKKGGYVKKQRKRKHYRASSFVKMKKKKKYKKKYIKT